MRYFYRPLYGNATSVNGQNWTYEQEISSVAQTLAEGISLGPAPDYSIGLVYS